ncbi:hypothetical protein GCM10023075_55900 [Streptosporangium album]
MPNASVSPVLARRTSLRRSSEASSRVASSFLRTGWATPEAGERGPANGHVSGIRYPCGGGGAACSITLEMNLKFHNLLRNVVTRGNQSIPYEAGRFYPVERPPTSPATG